MVNSKVFGNGKKLKVGCIVQARMGSTRLPGKVLIPVLDKPIIWHIVNRLRYSKLIDEIIIATTTKDGDEPIIDMAKKYSIPYYAGSEEDLIDRFYQASKLFNLDIVVRIAADRPVIDPQIVDKVINFFLKNLSDYDCVNNINPYQTYPHGLIVEVFSFFLVERLWKEIKDPLGREWFTTVIYENPQKYRIFCIKSDKKLPHLRLTLDYQEDLELIRYIYQCLYPEKSCFLLKDILALYSQNRAIFNSNKKHDGNKGYAKELKKKGGV